ncbi:MAG TPA: exosortase-associated EpsI family protein [Verrucomicrobiota bacterium]|nr:exosortase-associated EpsI family protein [Verrucomicrobiota bacterium]HNT13992.1 exosortase-associated EpsI family protein [Verrucomicrobiota bacterium]
MNRTKYLLAGITVLLIAGAAAGLARYKTIQRLGEPGVKTRPIPGSHNVEVVLPETVLDYTSKWINQSEIVTNTLPKDTCYGQRQYQAADQFTVTANVVLMGEDRASMHKPQFCLTGAGWTIDSTEVTSIPIQKPAPYDLSVIKLKLSGTFTQEGQPIRAGGVYVYWYVSDKNMSADPDGKKHMWSMARTLLTTGVLERWAYITFFAVCPPGQEDVTYERMKKLIAAAVPEFQLVHGQPPTLAHAN